MFFSDIKENIFSVFICTSDLCFVSFSDNYVEDRVLAVDEAQVFSPPKQLQVPETPMSMSDSALSAPDSDNTSSEDDDSSPVYAQESNGEGSSPAAPQHFKVSVILCHARYIFLTLYSRNYLV